MCDGVATPPHHFPALSLSHPPFYFSTIICNLSFVEEAGDGFGLGGVWVAARTRSTSAAETSCTCSGLPSETPSPERVRRRLAKLSGASGSLLIVAVRRAGSCLADPRQRFSLCHAASSTGENTVSRPSSVSVRAEALSRALSSQVRGLVCARSAAHQLLFPPPASRCGADLGCRRDGCWGDAAAKIC